MKASTILTRPGVRLSYVRSRSCTVVWMFASGVDEDEGGCVLDDDDDDDGDGRAAKDADEGAGEDAGPPCAALDAVFRFGPILDTVRRAAGLTEEEGDGWMERCSSGSGAEAAD